MPRFALTAGRIGLSHTICPACVDELRRTGKSV
jgi:ribosomal protein L32